MDPQADSDEEFIVLSTSDYAESASRHTRNVESFIKPFGLLPSLLRRSFKSSGTSEAYTRKYSEAKPGRDAAEPLVNDYYSSYHITGGFGGSGGEGGDQGGDGGAGHGPTVYFGQPEAREPSDFPTIRLGDLKLAKEVHISTQSGVVGRRNRGACARRIYHAEIRRDPGTVTVAMYQGEGAEEEWRQHVAKYESIRHPNIIQLYGLVSTKGLYAMVFHDELIPYNQFLDRFEHSPILKTYIIGYCITEFDDATKYIRGDEYGAVVRTRLSFFPVCLSAIRRYSSKAGIVESSLLSGRCSRPAMRHAMDRINQRQRGRVGARVSGLPRNIGVICSPASPRRIMTPPLPKTQ
ncbi:hypothetical protein MSAN_01508000 [Mycena sanguinolenta]|uniref:Protein kinase domain-containing protein n=1 Tax=Mycena sanguinolenta TaxID=230812 RepID=A0A8H7CZK0_9AGAR|nr:hypothetical protein MSAN_01508000 [Mycena sanguinolenta]